MDSESSNSDDDGLIRGPFVLNALRHPPPRSATCPICNAEFNPEGLYKTSCVDPKSGDQREHCNGGFKCLVCLLGQMQSDLMTAAEMAVLSGGPVFRWDQKLMKFWDQALFDKEQVAGPNGKFNLVHCVTCRQDGVMLAPSPVKSCPKPFLLQRFECSHGGCPVAIDVCTKEVMKASIDLIHPDMDAYSRTERVSGLYSEKRVRQLLKDHEAVCLYAQSQLGSVRYQPHGTFMSTILTRLKRHSNELDTRVIQLEHMLQQSQKEIDSLQEQLAKRPRYGNS